MDFIPFSDEALRIAANLAQRHDAWVDAIRRLEALPSSMFFTPKEGHPQYLTVKRRPGDVGTTQGVRSEATDLSRMHALMAAVNERIACEPAGTRTGIGAAGLGGDVTALDLHVEETPAHIACLPVGIVICCHSLRRCSLEV